MMSAAPVVVIALYGALWIALHAGGGRGSAHTLFQSLALAETVLALLLRRRKPVGALAGILAAYLLFDLGPLLLPAVLLALLTVAVIRDHRTVAVAAAAIAAVIAATPYIHHDTVSFARYGLAAAGAAVAAGIYLRTRRNRRAVNPSASVAEVSRVGRTTLELASQGSARPRLEKIPPDPTPSGNDPPAVCSYRRNEHPLQRSRPRAPARTQANAVNTNDS
jgi:hypothetical protein